MTLMTRKSCRNYNAEVLLHFSKWSSAFALKMLGLKRKTEHKFEDFLYFLFLVMFLVLPKILLN